MFSCENNDFVIWAAWGLELCKSLKSDKTSLLDSLAHVLAFLNLDDTSRFFQS